MSKCSSLNCRIMVYIHGLRIFALIGSVLESTKGGETAFYLSAGPNLTFCRCNKFRRDFKTLHLNSGTSLIFQQNFGKNVQNPKLSWSDTFSVRGCVVRGWVFHCRLDLRFPKIIPQLRVKNEIAILTSVFGYAQRISWIYQLDLHTEKERWHFLAGSLSENRNSKNLVSKNVSLRKNWRQKIWLTKNLSRRVAQIFC